MMDTTIIHYSTTITIFPDKQIKLSLFFISALCGPRHVCNLCSKNQIKQILLLLFSVLVLQILDVQRNIVKKILNKDHKMQIMGPHNAGLLYNLATNREQF